MLTIAQTLQVGKASIYLSANHNAKGSLFGARMSPISPLTIAMITDALEWGNDGGQDADDLRGLANYAYWLYGKFGLEAQRIVAEGNIGGSVVAGTIISAPERLDFLVSATSFLPTGTTSFTFPSTWSGFNIEFIRGGVPQSTITSESTYFSWNRTTLAFTCSPALVGEEQIIIIPV